MGNVLKSSYIDVHEAARCGHIEEVRRWIDAGKPVNARDNTQKTPLHHAAQWGQEETLDLLVSCGADVNATDFIEDTPLHFACYFGHANCVRNLTKAGAKVDAQDCYGNTPLRIFDDHVTEPVVDEIRLIVREVTRPPRHRPRSESSNTLNQKLPPLPATSLRTGGDSGNLQAANYGHLVANKNATRPGGKLDVFTAAQDRKVSVLKRALEDGANIDARDNKGLTLLMRAARAGRLSTAKFLVSQGANLGLKDTVTGFTALHFASYHCRDSVVRILLLAGADTKVRDKYGMLPGESFQPLSYLSFTAFQRRRAIRRFLSGDLQDGMDDKGKNMFPMNAPLEAYDEDHKPQYLRHESSNMLCASSEADIDTAYVDDSFRDGRKGTQSPPAGDSVIKYSLRKTSMQGLLFISNKLYGIYGESCNSTGEALNNDGEAAIILGAQGDLRLDLAEAGQWRPRNTENGKTANENLGRLTGAAEMGRRVPLKHHDGRTVHDGATNLVVHLNAKGSSHRSPRSRDGRRRSERSGRPPYDPSSAVSAASTRLPRHNGTCTPRIERDTSEITSFGGSATARIKNENQDVSRSRLLPPSRLESIGNLCLEQGALAGHLSPLHHIVETQSMSSKTAVSDAPNNHKQENRALKIDSRGERSDRKRRHRHRKHKRGRHRERKERGNDSSSPHRHRKHKRGRHRERKERGSSSSSPHRHRKHKRTDQRNRSTSSGRNRTESDARDRCTSCDMTAVGDDVQHMLYPTSPTGKNLAPLKRVPRQIHSGLRPTQISQSVASVLSPVTSTYVKGSDRHGDGPRVVADTGPLPSEAGGSEASLPNEASHM